MEIKDVLKELFRRHGTNANRLATALGNKPPQATIHRIETGESKDPRESSLKPIAKHFGVSLTQLRGEAPLDDLVMSPRAHEVAIDPSNLEPREEMALILFRGLFSHQQREVLVDLHARFEYAQFLRRDMGVKELNPIGDKKMEDIMGEDFPPKDKPKPRAKEPGRPPDAALPDE